MVDLDDPVAVALLATATLQAADVPHALYGGLLLGAYGDARETRDADLAVLQDDPTALVTGLRAAGLGASVSFAGMVFGGLSLSRIGLLGNAATSGVNSIDLVAPRIAWHGQAVLARSLATTLRGEAISVVAPEDFVVLKCLSTRDKDLDDGASVLARMATELDRAAIEADLARLAGDLPEVDLARRWAAMRERATSR